MANKNVMTLLAVVVLLASCSAKEVPEENVATVDEATTINTEVLVIGAGLSGLYAAMQLEQAGVDVLVLEARQRIGGRIYTLDNIPGSPEAGGSVIGASYARVIDTARALGVELIPTGGLVGGPRNQALHIAGEFIDSDSWGESPHNPFPDELKKFPPSSVLYTTLTENPLNEAIDWLNPAMQASDISVEEHLARAGFSEAAIELAYHVGGYGSSANDASVLQLYKGGALRKQTSSIKGESRKVKGGNQRLPEAMAKSLRDSVLTQKIVVEIQQNDERVLVTTQDGSVYRAQRVIASIPFTALRKIAISPELPALKRQAVDELSYSHVMQAHLVVNEDYSTEHAPSLWTDQIIERVFAFSSDGSDKATNAVIWINGSSAEQLSALSAEERDSTIMSTFYSIYPDAVGKVELAQVVDWGSDPFAGGSWADWSPGQISAFAQSVSEPVGRLHFSGEHTAAASPGMEGAMESGERAAAEVLTELWSSERPNNMAGELLYSRCNACHTIEPDGPHKVGPNLHGIVGSAAAGKDGFAYSEALTSAAIKWDRETLTRWIENPAEVVSGSAMIYQNTMEPSEINELINYLERADSASSMH